MKQKLLFPLFGEQFRVIKLTSPPAPAPPPPPFPLPMSLLLSFLSKNECKLLLHNSTIATAAMNERTEKVFWDSFFSSVSQCRRYCTYILCWYFSLLPLTGTTKAKNFIIQKSSNNKIWNFSFWLCVCMHVLGKFVYTEMRTH